MNQLFPIYGSVLKIITNTKKYDNELFFVNNYIDDHNIQLLSNNGLKPVIISFNENFELNDVDIIELQSIYTPDSGYAKQNNLIPGKSIELIFNEKIELQSIKGEITELNEDMITIKLDNDELIYIDFGYKGIDQKYNIEKIKIIPSIKKQTKFFIDLPDEDILKIQQQKINQNQEEINQNNNKEEEQLNQYVSIYSLDQQIDDYIEYYFKLKTKKSEINFEVNKYKELNFKYVDYENGIPIITLPKNQISNYLSKLNSNFFNPVTNYGYKKVYVNSNNIHQDLINLEYNKDVYEQNDYKLILHDEYDVFKELNDLTFNEDNIVYSTQKNKNEKYHKNIIYPVNTNLYLLEKKDVISNESYYYGVNYSKLKKINSDRINLDKNKKILLTGFLLENKNNLIMKDNLFISKTILNKSIQSLYPSYNIINKSIQKKEITDECELFDNKDMLYIPFQDKQKLVNYFSDINIKIQTLYNCFYPRKELNIYSVLQNLNQFGIFDMNNNDYKIIRNMVQKNISLFKNVIQTYKQKLNLNKDNFNQVNLLKSIMSNLIIEQYNIKNNEQKTDTEIIQYSMLDFHKLLLTILKKNNSRLFIDFNENEELANLIKELNEKLQTAINTNNNSIKKEIVKTYENLEEMYNDTNKIILKDLNNSKLNIYQQLYGNFVRDFNYNKNIDDFTISLRKILESNDLNNESHKELFSSPTIYENLIARIIELKVSNNDRCYVRSNKQYYIYDGNNWVDELTHKNSLKQKNVLKVKNRKEEFDLIKQNIMNDYILDIINNIENEKIKQIKLDDFNANNYIQNNLINNINKIKNNRKKQILKYNKSKEEIQKILLQSDYLNNIIKSPFENLFLDILSLQDSEDKFILIQKFIQNYTIDINDQYWFFCYKTRVKLVPKYLLKLSNAYLLYNNYDLVLNKICKEEGNLSENGDYWIHKYSGLKLKNIDFDTNYGSDEKGNIINLNEVLVVDEDDILDIDEDDEDDETVIKDFITKNNISIAINKHISLNETQKLIMHYFNSFNNIIGISIPPKDNPKSLVIEISNIFQFSKQKSKKTNQNILITYSILGFLIVYVQCNNLNVKKTFPGCSYSFEGYPLNPDINENYAIVYLSCILEIISKKNNNEPYIHFNKKNKVEIAETLTKFIKAFVLNNYYVTELISNARDMNIRDDIINNEIDIIKNPENFKPSLYDLDVPEINELKLMKTDSKYYSMMCQLQDMIHLLNKKLEENIAELMLNQEPILTTKYEQPYLINYCCNTNDFLINYITKTEKEKNELNSLLKLTIENEMKYKNIFNEKIRVQSLNIIKQKLIFMDNYDLTLDYDEITIYRYFIKHCNFDYDLPIPKMFLDIVPKKPSSLYYKKSENIVIEKYELWKTNYNKKIQILKENGYNFTQDMMIDFLKKRFYKLEKEEFVKKVNKNQDIKYQEFTELFIKEKKVDLFFTSETMNNISKYETYHINSKNNLIILKKLFNSFDTMNFENSELNSLKNFIKNINYYLINILPNFIMKSDKLNTNITCKHWDLAEKHYNDIKTNYKKFIKNIIVIDELSEDYISWLTDINEYKLLVNLDTYCGNYEINHLYQCYLLSHVLNLYMKNNDSDRLVSSINKSIISYISYMLDKNRFNYNNIHKRINQTKQSEKLMKTDYFKNLKDDQREAEKMKLNLKLGQWAFALNKNRVYKYAKDYYDMDKKEAIEVQEIVKNTYYHDEDKINPYFTSEDEIDDDQNIMNQEEYPMNLITGEDDYEGAYDENMDGDELYF